MADINIHLTEFQSKKLLSFPEKGMGYQVVDVILKNGKILHNKIVKNTKILQLEDFEKCQPEDISELVVL